MKLHLIILLLATFSFLASPHEALAVIQNLNGQTAKTQTFQNDTNIIISSSNNVHSLGWQGLLGISRGGTGASSFTAGSLFFFNGSAFAQDNSNLFWDDTNNRLGIGTSSPASSLDVIGDTSIDGDLNLGTNFLRLGAEDNEGIIQGIDATTSNTMGGTIRVVAGSGNGSGNGGRIDLLSGSGGETGNGADVNIDTGNGGETSGNAGNLSVSAGSAIINGNGGKLDFQAGHGGETSGNGGDITLLPGIAEGSGTDGKVIIIDPTSFIRGLFDTSSLSDDRTFTFPDFSGAFGLLEANQTWSGLNKFEASTNSTIYVGSSVKSGCIAMGDSDGSGVTWITANDGVLTASTTKPAICQ